MIIAGIAILVVVFFVVHRTRQNLFHTFEDSEFSDKYFIRGVDVSHHNAFINWERLRENNITFVYLKSTEGVSHKDSDYDRNYRIAKDAGLKTGTYHFYIFGLDGRRQAAHFIRNSHVRTGDLPPAIDVEYSSVNEVCADSASYRLMMRELKQLEKTFFNYYGKHPVIYTNKDCYRKYIKSAFPDNPIWICDLHGEPTEAEDRWVIWQFSHTGNIEGTVHDIDLNYYRYSFTDFQHLLIP